MAFRASGLLVFGSFLMLLGCNPPSSQQNLEVLAQGAPISGANGIIFDTEDRLFIASVLGNEIVVMDPESGAILDRMGPDRGVVGPDDLHFGPDGSLYWTSMFSGEVGRRFPDGSVSTQSLAPGVNPITFSDDGRLFVGLDFLGSGLYELDPDFALPPRRVYSDYPTNGMDWGPDGFLYAPTSGNVLVVDVETGVTRPLPGGEGLGTVKFDSRGRLNGLNWNPPGVVSVDIASGVRETVAELPPGADNLAFDSGDRLYVSSYWNGTIHEVLPGGETRQVSPGGLIAPGGIGVYARSDGRESVFVADNFSMKEYDGLTGDEVGQTMSWAYTVSVHGTDLVTASFFPPEVQVRDLEQTQPQVRVSGFVSPVNAVLFQGDLIVADLDGASGSTRVVRVEIEEPSNRTVLLDSSSGWTGLAAAEDNLWVTNPVAGTVLQVVADGAPLPDPLLVIDGLASPEGIAVDEDGSLLVVEAGAERLVRINPDTGEVSTVLSSLRVDTVSAERSRSSRFWGVALGPSGTIYVPSAENHLLALRPPA